MSLIDELNGNLAEAAGAHHTFDPELARLIIESATDFSIFTTDEDGAITGWNPGSEKLFGWSQAEVIGRHTRMLFTLPDQDAKVPEGEMLTAGANGRSVNERWHVRNDGTRFWGRACSCLSARAMASRSVS